MTRHGLVDELDAQARFAQQQTGFNPRKTNRVGIDVFIDTDTLEALQRQSSATGKTVDEVIRNILSRFVRY